MRYNPTWTGESLAARVRSVCDAAARDFDGVVALEWRSSGDAFHTAPGAFTDAVVAAVREATGKAPELSTSGGTSDARFIRALCPVVEFGLVGATMHKVDEHTAVADVEALTRVYEGVIRRVAAA